MTTEQLERENDILRGIATKVMPCHYCGVDSIAQCPLGFPGCALADDISVCEETHIAGLRARIAALQQALARSCFYCRTAAVIARVAAEIPPTRPRAVGAPHPIVAATRCKRHAALLDTRGDGPARAV